MQLAPALLLTAWLVPGATPPQDPPCAIGMVVRAGALNYDAKILELNPVTGLYKVQYVRGGDIEWVPPKDLKTCKAPAIASVPTTWFHGVWQLNVGGGGAWQQNASTGSWHVTGLDSAGAPPIRIAADGTFEWVINNAKTIRGRWRAAQTAELKYGYDKKGTAILLEKGEDDANWLVTRELVSTATGRDRILLERADLGTTYRGNRIGAAAPAGLKPGGSTTSTTSTSITKGNVVLNYDATKWDASATPNGFRLMTKDQRGFAFLIIDPDQHSATAFAAEGLKTMRAGDPTLKVIAQQQRTVSGTDAVVMRLDVTVAGSPYAYMAVFEGNARGGAELVTYTTPEYYPGHEKDFAALINGLQLK